VTKAVGIWYQHSWCIGRKTGKLYEPTLFMRDVYFGILDFDDDDYEWDDLEPGDTIPIIEGREETEVISKNMQRVAFGDMKGIYGTNV
jgi:hypothetical protein